MKIKDLPLNERPRERVIKYGIENISNSELLAIIIKTGTRKYSVKEIADIILSRINGISNLNDININTFNNIPGLGKVKTIELMAAIELGKRIFFDNKISKKIFFDNPDDIYLANISLFKGKKQEYFYVLYLDNRHNLIERKLFFM